MAYKITEDCIACAACGPECEEGAIVERDDVFAVDESRCTECGSCADICPVDSCVPGS